jgi:integrase
MGFFLTDRGKPLTASTVRGTFIKLSRQVGIRGTSERRGPRLHDLRHRFAVNTLLRWYQTGADVERHLPELSTYLGHQHMTYTYWYLSAVPELLRWAVARLEPHAEGSSS